MIHRVKGFHIVNKAEIDVFLELSCLFDDSANIGNLISGSPAFSKTSLTICNQNISYSMILTTVNVGYMWEGPNKRRGTGGTGPRWLKCTCIQTMQGSHWSRSKRHSHLRRSEGWRQQPSRKAIRRAIKEMASWRWKERYIWDTVNNRSKITEAGAQFSQRMERRWFQQRA